MNIWFIVIYVFLERCRFITFIQNKPSIRDSKINKIFGYTVIILADAGDVLTNFYEPLSRIFAEYQKNID